MSETTLRHATAARPAPAAVDYDRLRRTITWDVAERDLGYTEGAALNLGYLCSRRQVERGHGSRLALAHENHEGTVRRFTYLDLERLTNGWGAFLRDQGVREIDRVAVLLDRVPELYIGVVGVLKAGAVAQPLFSAFGGEAFAQRVEDSGATAVITQHKHLGKVRKARGRLPDLKTVIVIDHDDSKRALRDGEVAFDMTAAARDDFPIARTYPESPSILHYTSGTTGRPKGALHVHASIFAQHLTAKVALDLKDDDIYWCMADPGWVTGTSYGILAPWALGVAQVVLDAGFSRDRWYETLEKHRVTVWYTAPTAIRMLMKDGVDLPKKRDLSALRHMCSVGEPLNPEAVHWGRQAFGLDFHDSA